MGGFHPSEQSFTHPVAAVAGSGWCLFPAILAAFFCTPLPPIPGMAVPVIAIT